MSKERLTEKCWRNLDPWECCGQHSYCIRGCHDKGGCVNGCIVPKLYIRLAKYEDLEEQGLLLKLPCKVGDTVWEITNKCEEGYFDCCGNCDDCSSRKLSIEKTKFIINMLDEIGDWYFLTQSEAEEKLRELEG